MLPIWSRPPETTPQHARTPALQSATQAAGFAQTLVLSSLPADLRQVRKQRPQRRAAAGGSPPL